MNTNNFLIRIIAILWIILFLSLNQLANAEAVFLGQDFTDTTGNKNRLALIIGHANYTQLNPLNNPINDAQDISAKLTNLGFNVTLATDLDRCTMHKTISEFRRKISQETDIVLFYYAGHGAQYKNQSYLIPLRAMLDSDEDLPIEGLNTQDLLHTIENQRAKVNIMILDTCRDMPFKRTSRSAARGLAKINTDGSATLIAYATSPGETAADRGKNGRNSPYTEVLLEYLYKPHVPIVQLFNDIGYQVRTRYGQVPWTYSAPMPNVHIANQTPLASDTQIAKNKPNLYVLSIGIDNYTDIKYEFSSERCPRLCQLNLAATGWHV